MKYLYFSKDISSAMCNDATFCNSRFILTTANRERVVPATTDSFPDCLSRLDLWSTIHLCDDCRTNEGDGVYMTGKFGGYDRTAFAVDLHMWSRLMDTSFPQRISMIVDYKDLLRTQWLYMSSLEWRKSSGTYWLCNLPVSMLATSVQLCAFQCFFVRA